MSNTAQEAYDEIVAHIIKQGDAYNKWYAGIASDPKKRLFTDHNVSEKNAWWVYRECPSNGAARNVEKSLLELGCDGGSGGGDSATTYVYAYLKTSSTDP